MDLQSLPWYLQLLVFLVIGGIVIGIFYYIHYSPNQDTINRINTDIEAIEQEIKRAEQKEAKLKQIQEELEIKKTVLEKLKAILPEKEEISQILKKIQSIISNARLRIQKYDPQTLRTRNIIIESPISIILEGNYHNLGIFFDQLSKLKKIYTVDGLNISPLRRMTREFSIRASFTATTYLYREVKPKKKRSRRSRRGKP
jgi:type IV pilus assembly protein PilO